VGENDPGILVNAAFVLAYFGEEIDPMIGLVHRALALNPSFARGWYLSGIIRLWASQPPGPRGQGLPDRESALR
jgi:hypothetical protein